MKIKLLPILSFFIFTLASASQAAEIAAENNNLKLTKPEAKVIVEALILGGQVRKDELSVAHVDKAVQDYMLYKGLVDEAETVNLEDSLVVQKLLEMERLRSLSRLYLKQYAESIDLPNFEAAAREEYTVNKSSFKRPESIRAQHILIEIGENEQEAKAKAESIRQKVLSGQYEFAKLAEEYSDDPSVKSNKGDLGFSPRGRMAAEFEKAAFSLKPGEVSELVKSQFGFHIIKLIDRKPEKILSFDEVKGKLINNLEVQYKRDAYNDKMREIVMASDFKINEDILEQITEEIKSSK